MLKVIKNTTGSIVPVGDVGIQIPASGAYTVPPQDYLLWSASVNAVTLINAGTLVVNDGTKDLTKKNGLAYLVDLEIRTTNIVSVSKTPSGAGDFTSIATAIASIISPSSSNPYLVSIGPGVYVEPILVIPSHVTLQGQADEATTIKPDATNHDVIRISGSHVAIYDLGIEDVGVGYHAISADDAGEDIELLNISFENCDGGLYVRSVSKAVSVSVINIFSSGTYKRAIECLATNGYSCFLSIVNGVFGSNYPSMSTPHVYVTGPTARLECPSVRITGPLGGATDYGIQVENGAEFRFAGGYIRDCKTGLYVPNTGTAPNMKILNMRLDNVTTDINIAQPSTTGHFSGSADEKKITNAAFTTISLNYADPISGDYNVSRILHTRGFATDLTSIVAANQVTSMVSYDSHTYIVIGSITGQVLKLPNATTLRVGHQFYILNESSTNVTLQNFAGVVDQILKPETNTLKVLLDNSTPTGVWTKSVGVNFAAGKLRDPKQFTMNGTMGNGDWVSVSNLLSDYKYVFTEPVNLIGIEWSNANGNDRDFDLVFYKNGIAAGNIIRTYQVRNSTFDYGYDSGWSDEFVAGDYMRVKYVDRGKNCADFGGRFNFEVVI